MRIGLDARFLTHPQFGGFKTYTSNLVAALAEVDGENEYIVYVDRAPAASDSLPRQSNFTFRPVSARWPLIGMPVREQWGLRRGIAADRPDLVHFLCNTMTIGLTTPHIVTLHDRLQLIAHHVPLTGGPGAVLRWALAAYSRRTILPALATAARVITVSHHERDAISQDYAIPPERIVVTHEAAGPQYRRLTGSDLERGRRDLSARLSIRPPFIVGVGFEPRKQIPTLIRAVGRLGADHAGLHLVLVASAPGPRREFGQLASELGLAERVTILGAASPDEMVLLYNLADALVFPSLQEGFGLPPLEAMACGAPVIARRATSVPEIVGDAAVLVDSGDPAAWTSAIDRVRSSPALRDDLSRRGLERAASFSWRRCAEQTVAVYRQVGEEVAVTRRATPA